MLFNSQSFIFIFLPLMLLGFKIFRGKKLTAWLMLSSLVFYGFAGPVRFLVPMLFTTILDFYMAQAMEKNHNRPKIKKVFLGISLIGNVGLLVYFKYGKFLFHNLAKIDAIIGLHFIDIFNNPFANVLLPAGISFYTFQTLSYIIDVYHGDCPAEKSFNRFVCFVSFFPHLVAGPLTRHHELIPQLHDIEAKGPNQRWSAGIFLFAIGLVKKVMIADRVGNLIDPYLIDAEGLTIVTAWLTVMGYSMQIYFDFSGYSDMAIGLGRLFGVELPNNFNSPYKAINPSDYWARWHMTLSRWLRDYIFSPIVNGDFSNARIYMALLTTMTIGGIWHGANWTFAIWGVFHGLVLILYYIFKSKWDLWPVILQRIAMFFLISISWVLFRSPNIKFAGVWFKRLIEPPVNDAIVIHSAEIGLALMIIVGHIVTTGFNNASNSVAIHQMPKASQLMLAAATAVAIIMMNHSSKFLYFQF